MRELLRAPRTERSDSRTCIDNLVTFPADLGAGLTHQEIEVDALIRLGHGFAIELDPAAIGMRLGWLPFGFAPCELGVGYVQMDAATGDIELDHVAVLDQRQRP